MSEAPLLATAIPRMFFSPQTSDWAALDKSELGQDEAEAAMLGRNERTLREMLLSSLQMQHVVVLAGSGCSIAAGGPSMTDLWNATVGQTATSEATAVAKKVNYDLGNRDIEAFLSSVEAYLQVQTDVRVESFLTASKETILTGCKTFVETKTALRSHETFLHRLSRRRARDPRLKIFTTNYDVCFERAASALGNVVLDGFSFGWPRIYDPRFFSYDIVRRPHGGQDTPNFLEGVCLLYKLHGSVSWDRTPEGNIVEVASPEAATACLIYPAKGKYQQSYTQPYLESMAQFLSAVREPNTCLLIAGFGFNDAHLAEPVLSAARSNPHLRILIVDRSAKERFEGENPHWRALATLASRGSEIWFIQAEFPAFAEMIPDLKSLTPAQNLMRAVRGAVEQP